jgi:hypothetical protein
MSEANEPQDGQSSARGEAAWKAHKALIAERNQKARKAGKEERLKHERRVEAQRREAGR